MANKPARRGKRRSPAKTAGTGRGSPSLWIVLLCLLPVVVLVWFLMQLEAGRDEVRRVDAVRQRKPAAQTAQKPAEPKYDFYKKRPKDSTNPPPVSPPEPKTPPVKPAPPKTEVARADAALRGEIPAPRPQYFLQAGSFRKSKEAERLRAQLALLGQITRLEQGKVGRQIWHRVMIGPFESAAQMTQAQNQLEQQGFKSLLPQQR
ncbi:hypothetical protein AXE65_11130 [Ventosimonas gracilis]|uniref:SPOR domain-containing protein n=1 Tax=Ventosimonas gracilis TaxID=1680762 RepID=A0A139SWI0_9GAMM|nr:SPOR domain-containing protein [Ventosimonas gracilis]KXU38986.1 hypothetical protein AXE65_11130 [Ventosimonas gracilis]